MHVRHHSKTGPVAPSTDLLIRSLTDQIGAVKRQWLDRLTRDPASFARLEMEIHEQFHHLADQMTASLLAEATPSGDRAEPAQKGGARPPTDPDVPPRSVR